MTTDEGIKYDRSLLGKSHNIGTIKVTKEMIIKFSRSTGETNDIHLGNEGTQQPVIAPPTMCNMFVTGASRPDIKLDFGDINLFAGQSIECKSDIKPGDVLEGKTQLESVYSKTGRSGKMVFSVWLTTFVNQDSKEVAIVTESYVRRNKR